MSDDFEDIIGFNFAESIAEQNLDLPRPVGQQDDSQSQVDPEILELQKQIAGLLNLIEDASDEATALTEFKKEVEIEKRAFVQEVNARISAFDAKMREAALKKKEIDRQLEQAELQKKKLIADLDHSLEAKRAKKLLEEARSRWSAIIAEHDWLWARAAREYQQVGIEFIASAVDRDLGGIALLDQMGLGKTLQARGAVDLIQNHPRFTEMLNDRLSKWNADATWTSAVLWVCPDQIKETTRAELAKWTDANVIVLESVAPGVRGHVVNLAYEHGFTLVVGYAQLRERNGKPVTPELYVNPDGSTREWPIMVADEIQEARNENTSTFQKVRQLVGNTAMFIPMTGTPVENKAIEFWVILHLITQKGRRQGEFPSSARFERMYLWSSDQQYMHGAFEKLMGSVADMVLRRRKDEVAIDLPDKTRSVRFVRMTGRQRELYDHMRERLYIWLDEQKGEAISASNFLAQLSYLRQIALLPSGVKIKHEDDSVTTLDCDESAKIDDAMALVRSMMQSDEKVLIFANFKEPLYHIQKLIADEGLTWTDAEGNERLVQSGAITGDVKGATRAELVQRFNDPNDDLRVIVGTVKSMGLGLNLQGACSQCIFLDLYWNPARNEQAEDRLHRSGQKNNVTVHIIQGEQCVDAFIAEIIERKGDTFDAMFERKELRRALDEGLI